jgi:transposase
MFKIKFKNEEDPHVGFIIAMLLLLIYTIISWIVNLYKLTQCDFVGPWKEEVIHIIGLVPAFSWVTCWC